MADIHWAEAVNGRFTTAADWTGGVVPGASDDAILDAAGADFKVSSSADETVESVQTAANATLSITGGTFTASEGTGAGANLGSIDVGAATLSVSGTLENEGLIALASGAVLNVGTTSTTLSGGGQVTLGGVAEITGEALTNVDNTLTGGMNLQVAVLTNESAGVLHITGSLASEMSHVGVTNAGLMEVTGSGGLSAVDGAIDNVGGDVQVANGSVLSFTDEQFVGGTLSTQGSGAVDVGVTGAPFLETDAVFHGEDSPLDLDATLTVLDGFGLLLIGAIQNQGSISIDSTASGQDHGDPTYLNVGSGGATLSGGGSVTLSDNSNNNLFAADPGNLLTNLDNTISGAGLVGAGKLALTNEAAGVVDATGTKALIVDTGTWGFSNTGLIEATGKGGMVIRSSTLANAGGVLFAAAGFKVILQKSDIKGGTLASAGDGSIQMNGPGNTIDGTSSAVDITGEVLVLVGGSLTGEGEIDVSGKLVDKGSANLNGPLTNNGELETVGGTLTVQGSVAGAGDAVIDGGAMTFGSSFSQKVVFDGGGELILADSQGYAGTVWKFSTSGTTSLELQDIAFAGAAASYSGTAGQGVLTVTSGAEVARITFKGDYLGTTFSLSEDLSGATIITDNAAVPAAATIAQAIAAFAPSQAASASVTHAVEHRAPLILSRPGTATA